MALPNRLRRKHNLKYVDTQPPQRLSRRNRPVLRISLLARFRRSTFSSTDQERQRRLIFRLNIPKTQRRQPERPGRNLQPENLQPERN
jgi:hypothetical protein